jgi:hypothetical protein
MIAMQLLLMLMLVTELRLVSLHIHIHNIHTAYCIALHKARCVLCCKLTRCDTVALTVVAVHNVCNRCEYCHMNHQSDY